MFRKKATPKCFGVMVDPNSGIVPTLIIRCVDFLNRFVTEEGIFRLAGSSSEINAIRAQWDKGGSPQFEPRTAPHTVANLLKAYLREMPEPLLTHSRYDAFIAAAGNGTDYNARVTALTPLITSLPATYKKACAMIFGLLYNIASNAAINSMTPQNLAICIGPTMLRSSADQLAALTTDAGPANLVFCTIIESYPQLFCVPGKSLHVDTAAAPIPPPSAGPADIPPPPAAGGAIPPPPPPDNEPIGPPSEGGAPGAAEGDKPDPKVWAFREKSYKTITQLYDWTNGIYMELPNVESVSELVFLGEIIWSARTAITKELSEKLPLPKIELKVVKPPQNKERLFELLDIHVDTMCEFIDDVGTYVEQMANYMSLLTTLEPLIPVDERFQWLASVLSPCERVIKNHEGISPTATLTDDQISADPIDRFDPEDDEQAGPEKEQPSSDIPPPPPSVPAPSIPPPSVAAPSIPPPSAPAPSLPAPPAEPEPKFGPPPPPPVSQSKAKDTGGQEVELGAPPPPPPSSAQSKAKDTGGQEVKLGAPPPPPTSSAQPSGKDAGGQEVKLGAPPPPPSSGGLQPKSLSQFARMVMDGQKKQVQAGAAAAAASPAAAAKGPTKKAAPGSVRAPSMMIAAASAVAATTRSRLTGDMLVNPLKLTAAAVSYIHNDFTSLDFEGQKALADLTHKLRLLVDHPGRDLMELSMLDTTLGQSSGTGLQLKIKDDVEHVKKSLERLVPFCTPTMPPAQIKIVASIISMVCKMVKDHDTIELENLG